MSTQQYNVPSEDHTIPQQPRSTLVSRNVTVSGKRTSVRLEPEMWDGLQEICRRERSSLHQIVSSVSIQKAERTSLTAAIRVFIMRYFRMASTEDGHNKAGHGYGLTLGMGNGMGTTNAAPRFQRPQTMQLTKTSFA